MISETGEAACLKAMNNIHKINGIETKKRIIKVEDKEFVYISHIYKLKNGELSVICIQDLFHLVNKMRNRFHNKGKLSFLGCDALWSHLKSCVPDIINKTDFEIEDKMNVGISYRGINLTFPLLTIFSYVSGCSR